MSINPYTKSFETKLYFIVFALFSSFLTLLIYHSSLDTVMSANESISKATTPFQQHFQAVRTATSSRTDVSGWKTYRNEKYGFEIKLPAEWHTPDPNQNGPWSLTSNTNIAHGVGLPVAGMWVDVSNEICNKTTLEFEYEGPKPHIYEKWTCPANFQVVVGYWPLNPTRVLQNESTLNQILNTFKSL